MVDVRRLDVKLDPKGSPGDQAVTSMVHELRPEWNRQYDTQTFRGGSMNLIIKYWKKEGSEDDADALMVRIMGELSYLISEPDISVFGVRALSTTSCCPEVLCQFANGYVYQFVPGSSISYDGCSDEHTLSLVAAEMARYHRVDAAAIVKTFPGDYELSTQPQLFPRFKHFLSLVDENLPGIGPPERSVTKADLVREVECVRSRINLDPSKVVMQHGDLYPGNFLHDKDKDEIKFIDYEWVGYNYQAFDLAYFLNTQFHFPYPKMEVTFGSVDKGKQLHFFRTYLNVFGSLGDETLVDENEIAALYEDCKLMGLGTLLYRAILCYALVGKSIIPIDLTWFGNVHLEEYMKRKEEFDK